MNEMLRFDVRSQSLCAVHLNGNPSGSVVRYQLPNALQMQHRVCATDHGAPVSGSACSCARTLCSLSLVALY